MSQKLFHVWYRREFTCEVWAEDELEARTVAQKNDAWRLQSEGDLYDEYLEVSED